MQAFVGRWLCATLAAALLCAGAAQAQTQGPVAPRQGVPLQKPPAGTIRVKVNLVSAPVTVRDKSGELILDLDKPDFRVFDNGVEQRLEEIDLGGDPISLLIAIESSSRIEPMLPAIRKSGILFTEAVLGEKGRAAVMTYDDDVRLYLPFSSDRDKIHSAVANFRMGTSGVILYDAMARGVELLEREPQGRRRVMIVVGEAADTGSESKLGEVLRAAQLAGVVIYSVGISSTAAQLRGAPQHRGPSPMGPEGTFPVPGRAGRPQTPTTEQQDRQRADLMALLIWIVQQAANAAGENALELATAGTGGAHFATVRDASIEKAISQIAAELHAQYTLTYRPEGVPATGYHEIKVELARANARDLQVRSRPGYYVEP